MNSKFFYGEKNKGSKYVIRSIPDSSDDSELDSNASDIDDIPDRLGSDSDDSVVAGRSSDDEGESVSGKDRPVTLVPDSDGSIEQAGNSSDEDQSLVGEDSSVALVQESDGSIEQASGSSNRQSSGTKLAIAEPVNTRKRTRASLDSVDQPCTSTGNINCKRHKKSRSSASTKKSAKPVVKQTRGCAWVTGSMAKNEATIKFSGDSTLPQNIVDLPTPFKFFTYLFPPELDNLIVQQTNLFCTQTRPEKPLQLTPEELHKFWGILCWMTLIRLPSTRKYWAARYRVSCVSNVMPLKRFEAIKRFLHAHDNQSDNEAILHDKIRKIRPVVNFLCERLNTIPKEESLCVDEQIIPFKGRSCIKQFNPKKPHKWGYKLFILSGVSGFCYNMEVYTGSENIQAGDEADLGASSNTVIRMARTIPSDLMHKLYFDNYFTGVNLQVCLAKRGIHCVGTVRPNRLAGITHPSDKELSKRGRGACSELMTTVDGIELSSVRWMDKKSVNLSTFVGCEPPGKARRWSQQEKKFVEIDRPSVVNVYNRHMGGVDLLDSLIGLYRTRVRSKKWYHRILFHLIDATVVNAWLLYRRARVQSRITEGILPLADFKAAVAESLCKYEKTEKRGRRSTELQRNLDTKIPRPRSGAPNPQADVRLDAVGHWLEWSESRQRCRMPLCKGITQTRCQKCDIPLCFTKNRNCFKNFHTN